MTGQEKYKLACELSSLCVFRGLLQKAPMAALVEFLKAEGQLEQMNLFGTFVFSLAEDGYCFSDFLKRAVFENENQYIVSRANRHLIPAVLEENVKAELGLFSKLTKLSADVLCETDGYLPRFENREVDFAAAYAERVENVRRYGYGVFASARMFRLVGDELLPVKTADEISIDHFVGYAAERQKVLDNTRALVEGKIASNILLYGDAGTGKSSTVKACANHFYEDGVRLIELRKDQLFSLPRVMEKIAGNPLKFIIFIDDLSFNKNDDSFSMLKAALEGSASAKAKNAVIYATSNRRHIVKERFSDRTEKDDIHHNDTMQELLSLSDRFGLTVYFEKPQKKLYLEIVQELAERAGITLADGELDIKAEAFALAKGSRSPRAAEQFVASLME